MLGMAIFLGAGGTRAWFWRLGEMSYCLSFKKKNGRVARAETIGTKPSGGGIDPTTRIWKKSNLRISPSGLPGNTVAQV
jgi:hypothetical protein